MQGRRTCLVGAVASLMKAPLTALCSACIFMHCLLASFGQCLHHACNRPVQSFCDAAMFVHILTSCGRLLTGSVVCRYLSGLFALAHDPSTEVRKAVCTGLVQMLQLEPDRLQPHMHDIIEYMLASTQVGTVFDAGLQAQVPAWVFCTWDACQRKHSAGQGVLMHVCLPVGLVRQPFAAGSEPAWRSFVHSSWMHAEIGVGLARASSWQSVSS